MQRYEGKTAVIVGGTHGMGLATARLFAAEGGAVVVTGRDPANVAAAGALAARIHAARSDVTKTDDVEALEAAARERFGGLDLVFLNAGIGAFEPFDAVTEATYDRFFAVNARGVFFAAQRLAPLLRKGGAMIFTTVTPGPASAGLAVYSATKAAVRAFARTMAVELLPRGVRVNAIAPGFIDTPTLGVAGASPEERAELSRLGDALTPMRRHGAAEEVARAVLFLAFEATYTTGAELPVDGGLSQIERPLDAV